MLGRSRRTARFCLDAVRLIGSGLTLLVMLSAGGVRAEDPAFSFLTTSPRLFKVCTGQTYALCAVRQLFCV